MFAAAVALVTLAFSQTIAAAETSPAAAFENHIRPVLVATCLGCHGDAKVSGMLRVDSRAGLLQGGESGPAIVPGSPESSLLIQAIERHADVSAMPPDDVSAMPPDKDQALRPDQVAAFRSWISNGANWPSHAKKLATQSHWAFEPLSSFKPPATIATAQHPIDAFVSVGRLPADTTRGPVADKRTLIRRATFDLTGLPPSPAAVEAFVADDSPAAFASLIDRLLDSTEYGRRWGRHWLDVVRYADTAGETADYPVPLAWRYRNYVIDAFNDDKPYDQFLREQIAGDILANQSPLDRYAEQVIATGYLAISRRFGFDSEHYHHLTIQDTIDNLGQTVLGLSLGCARCHDHKFDAISMHDYYGLYAIFDSSRYPFPGSEQKQKCRAMAPLVPPSESTAKWRRFDQRVATLAARLEGRKQSVTPAMLRSLADIDGDFELQAPAAGGSYGVLVSPWLSEGKVSVTTAAQSPFKNRHSRGKVGVSVAAEADHYRIAQSLYPHRTRDDCPKLYFNLDFRVADDVEATGMHRISLGSQFGATAFDVLIGANTVSLQRGDQVTPIGTLTANMWHNLQLQWQWADGSISGALATETTTQKFSGPPLAASTSLIDFVTIASTTDKYARAPAIDFDNLDIQEEAFPAASTALPDASPSHESVADSLIDGPGDAGGIRSAVILDNDETREDAIAAEKEAQELHRLLTEGPFETAYGMSEGTPHKVAMHLRGEPSRPGDQVTRGFVQVLGSASLPPETTGSGRLELARWLTTTNQALTARVMVNRIWQYHFGRGLVTTPNDFGVRGVSPTHPELLDFLAIRFIDSGWSVKAMHRLIMRSATYQLSSQAPSKVARELADYEHYRRFSRRRLSAEEIRDAILMVSGELDREGAQEHPFPPAIEWGFTQHAPFSAVYDHKKRSIYLMTQRMKRHPYLALFDGADPNATTAERLGTTVPTQALYFLNDPFVHTNAAAWARQLQGHHGTAKQTIEQAYLTAYSRPVTAGELAAAEEFMASYQAELATLAKEDSGEDTEAAALAALLRTVLASNEFLHVD